MQDMQTKPNGPVAAAFVAAGVGSLAVGLFVVLNEISPDINCVLEVRCQLRAWVRRRAPVRKGRARDVVYFVSWSCLTSML